MARTPKERLRDILDAIADIRRDTAGLDAEGFESHPAVIRAVLYSMVVIGEAVKHLPEAFTATRPEIPWQDVAAMRNVVVHEYFRSDSSLVWNVIENDLEPLERLVREALLEKDME